MASSKDSKLSSKQAALLREKIQTICDAHKTGSVDLCMAVYESYVSVVKVEGDYQYCWQTWGYKSWEEFLGKEMDLHITTAYILKKVWEVFYIELQGAWSRDLLLGITKMKILSRAQLTHANVESWLKRAKKMTARELRARIFGEEELHSFAVHLTGTQMRHVRRALEDLKSAYGDDSVTRGELLVRIATEWRATHKPTLRAAAAA